MLPQDHAVSIVTAGDYHAMLKVKTPKYGVDFSIMKSPTGNCQLTSIGYMNSLLGNIKETSDKTSPPNKNIIRAVIFEGYRLIGYTPKIIFVDVNQCYINGLVHCFAPEEILVKNEYKSSNGSDMCAFILNVWKG